MLVPLASVCLAFVALQPGLRPGHRAAQLLVVDGGSEEDAIEDAVTFRRGKKSSKKDQRDRLLYDVTEVTPPPTRLGMFKLEPSLACGDLIATGECGASLSRCKHPWGSCL